MQSANTHEKPSKAKSEIKARRSNTNKGCLVVGIFTAEVKNNNNEKSENNC